MCNYFLPPGSLSNVKYGMCGKMCWQSSKVNYLIMLSVNMFCKKKQQRQRSKMFSRGGWSTETDDWSDGEEKIRKKEQFRKCKCRGTPCATPPPPLCGARILRHGSLYQKHHSWMRRRPLRKISCHPFLKIFVNLVSSVCGFISTCINVSSLVTEPQYLGEDIIKNVWGVGGGRGGLLRSGRGRKDGVGGGVWEEEGEVFLSSRSFPWEPLKHRAGDNRQTSSPSLPRSLVSLGSVCAAISLMALAPLIWPRSGNWPHC